MGILVRRYQESDREAFGQVHADVYRNGEPLRPEEAIEREGLTTYVAELNGRIVGGYRLYDADWSWNGGFLPGVAVAAVAVSPVARRLGAGSAMMRDCLRRSREMGKLLAALYPFRSSYYRQFGYENCGTKLRITCPQHRLPEGTGDPTFRRLNARDVDAIDACHRQHSKRYNGVWLRSTARWSDVLKSTRPIFGVGQPLAGYAIQGSDDGFWVPARVDELVWKGPGAYGQLMALLSSLAANKTSITWHEPSDSPFVVTHLEQGITVEQERPIMYRIVDVPKCLERLRALSPLSFTIEVVDEVLPENSGVWSVQVRVQASEVQPGSNPDLRLSVNRLAQAFMGEPSLEQLVQQEAISVLNMEGVEQAMLAMPRRSVYCLDHF